MKLAFFGSSSSFITSILYKELCNILKHRKDIELVAIIDCDKNDLKHKFMRQGLLMTLTREVIFYRNSICGKTIKYFGIMKGKRVKNINNLEFIRWLKDKGVEAILSVSCIQKFSKELIDNFYCINYHNSLLPKYRGMYSGSWPIYLLDDETGFTFHRIVSNFDSGNILLQQKTPIPIVLSYQDVLDSEASKAIIAASMLDKVLDRIIVKHKGITQIGCPTYYGQKELDALPKNKWTSICFGWNKVPEEYIPRWILKVIK